MNYSKKQIEKPLVIPNKIILKLTTVPTSLKILLKGQLKFLSENGFDVYSLSANGVEIEDLYENESIKEHFIVNMKRTISPLHDLIAIWKCFLIIRKLKPDIVHSYTPKAGLIGMIAAKMAGVKIRMHNITGLPLVEKTGIVKKVLILVEQIVYKAATHVYVNSRGLKSYIHENISSEVTILGEGSTNGINTEHFRVTAELELSANQIRDQYAIKSDDFLWIYVGRLVRDKGIIELINAFNLFSDKYPSKLMLVGEAEGKLNELPPNIVEIISNNKNIIRTGFQNDVRPFFCAANCLIFPSYREGLPNVPMQAACLGLPIIATDINGCNEIIINSINGILIEPKNINALVEAMNRMYIDVVLRNKIKTSTRDLVVEKFAQQKVWDNLLIEYKKNLSNVI